MDTPPVSKQPIKGLWWATLGIVLFVPLPWYICLFGCKWVFEPLMSSFAWFRLILLSPWVTPLAFLLPIVYIIGIHYLLARYIDRMNKKNLILVACGIGALYLISTLVN